MKSTIKNFLNSKWKVYKLNVPLFLLFVFISCSNNLIKASTSLSLSQKNSDLRIENLNSNLNVGYPIGVFISKKEIQLDTTSAISEFYEANIIVLGFKSEEEAMNYFNSKTDNLIAYTLDYATSKVIIQLHLTYADSSWGVSEWNKYINDKLKNE
ncbi:MAG TPA: hypothetical protein PKK00_11175 [Bacteroidales bacterium]|nr:hypothetical protein [Bacteroidales bacterium]HPS17889.1 hypothetical protein [Bacteroidales bacterium]